MTFVFDTIVYLQVNTWNGLLRTADALSAFQTSLCASNVKTTQEIQGVVDIVSCTMEEQLLRDATDGSVQLRLGVDANQQSYEIPTVLFRKTVLLRLLPSATVVSYRLDLESWGSLSIRQILIHVLRLRNRPASQFVLSEVTNFSFPSTQCENGWLPLSSVGAPPGERMNDRE